MGTALTKDVDVASLGLVRASALGTTLDEARIEVCTTTTADTFCYSSFIFQSPRLTSYALVGGASGQPTDSFTFEFERVQATYYKRLADGRSVELYTFTLPP